MYISLESILYFGIPGGIAGVLVYKLIEKRRKKIRKSEKIR